MLAFSSSPHAPCQRVDIEVGEVHDVGSLVRRTMSADLIRAGHAGIPRHWSASLLGLGDANEPHTSVRRLIVNPAAYERGVSAGDVLDRKSVV